MEAQMQMPEPDEFETELPEPDSSPPEFGVLMAPVGGEGTWAALKELRAGLRDLRAQGTPKVLFIDALDEGGKVVAPHDSGAVAVVLGYTLSPS